MSTEPIAGTRFLLHEASMQQVLDRAHDRLAQAVEHVVEGGAGAPDRPRLSETLAVLAAADRLGHHDVVRRSLYRLGRNRRLSGEIRIGSRQWEGTGCALWSLVDHARLTADMTYLKTVYRSVRRGLIWLRRRRTPDGSRPHTGLMLPPPERAMQEADPGRYPIALWSLAGAQEAARAASALDRKGHAHDAEAFFFELRRALLRSLGHTARERGGPGLPADPGEAIDARAAESLVALIPGDVMPPDQAHVAATLEALVGSAGELPLAHQAAIAQHLLRRGDRRAWDLIGRVVERWEREGGGGGDTAHLIWLLRNVLVSDQHELLLVAPGYALLPSGEAWAVEVEKAPTRFGPVSYRLEGAGSELTIRWAPLSRSAPRHLIWPLPAKARRLEPPRATLTASRMALRLPPDGGHFRVELLRHE